MDNKKKSLIGTILIMAAIALIVVFVWNNLAPTPTEIDYVTFRQEFENGFYKTVSLDIYTVTCVGNDNKTYTFVIADRNAFESYVVGVLEDPNTTFSAVLPSVVSLNKRRTAGNKRSYAALVGVNKSLANNSTFS